MLRIRRQRLTRASDQPPRASSSRSLTIDAIAHRDETDHRIVQQLAGRALLDRNSLASAGQRGAATGGGRACLLRSSARPNPRQTLHPQGLLDKCARQGARNGEAGGCSRRSGTPSTRRHHVGKLSDMIPKPGARFRQISTAGLVCRSRLFTGIPVAMRLGN
jgi:hypothetical protein